MTPTNNQVILDLNEYNAMRDELRELKEEIAEASQGSYIRSIIIEKAEKVFNGPVLFSDEIRMSSRDAKNLLLDTLEERDEEKVENVEEVF